MDELDEESEEEDDGDHFQIEEDVIGNLTRNAASSEDDHSYHTQDLYGNDSDMVMESEVGADDDVDSFQTASVGGGENNNS
jgi:hypothetical protein